MFLASSANKIHFCCNSWIISVCSFALVRLNCFCKLLTFHFSLSFRTGRVVSWSSSVGFDFLQYWWPCKTFSLGLRIVSGVWSHEFSIFLLSGILSIISEILYSGLKMVETAKILQFCWYHFQLSSQNHRDARLALAVRSFGDKLWITVWISRSSESFFLLTFFPYLNDTSDVQNAIIFLFKDISLRFLAPSRLFMLATTVYEKTVAPPPGDVHLPLTRQDYSWKFLLIRSNCFSRLEFFSMKMKVKKPWVCFF